MTKKLSISTLIFILCAELAYVYTPYHFISSDLLPYYRKVQSVVDEHCEPYQYNNPRQVLYNLGDLSSGTIGMCSRNAGSYSIIVDKTAWRYFDEAARMTVMYHEMAHCLFFQPHLDDLNSFMYPERNPWLTEMQVRQQFEELLRDKCGR